MDDANRAMTDPDNPLFSMAAGKMRNQGFEVGISGSPPPGWDIAAGYRFNKHVGATLTVNNLFDKVYYQRVWAAYGSNYYGEPRSVMLAVRATY